MPDLSNVPIYKASSAILLLIVIVLLYSYVNNNNALWNDNIYGYWIADDDYCEEADVSSMMLFIGEPEDSYFGKSKKRDAYLVINNDITNQLLKLKFGRLKGDGKYKYTSTVNIEFEEDCGMPETMTLEFDVLKGTMRMYEDETMYGLFYKNHEISNIVNDK